MLMGGLLSQKVMRWRLEMGLAGLRMGKRRDEAVFGRKVLVLAGVLLSVGGVER